MWRTITAAAVLITLTSACSSGGDSEAAAIGANTVDVPAVSAADVTAAVTAAGLEVVNPRDNTDGWCGPNDPDMLACTEMLTTDLFTVRVWLTPEDAQHWVNVVPGDAPIVLAERTTVDLHEGGSTPTYDRAAYEAAINTLNT